MGEENNSKNQPKTRGFFKIFIVLVIIAVIIFLGFYTGFFSKNKSNAKTITIENPLKDIVSQNTKGGEVDEQAVIKQGVLEFNENYINYLMLALGVGKLHSFVGFGNPVVEMHLDNEIWSSEIQDNSLRTIKSPNDNKDLRIIISKEEAVKALLSPNIAQFMKDSVASGRTQLEMVAGKTELFSKGYLEMYNGLK
jgi:hypothetical protein